MKKRCKILTIIITLMILFLFAGDKPNQPISVSITCVIVEETTIPEIIFANENINEILTKIVISINHSDGSVINISLNENMLSKDDILKFGIPGHH